MTVSVSDVPNEEELRNLPGPKIGTVIVGERINGHLIVGDEFGGCYAFPAASVANAPVFEVNFFQLWIGRIVVPQFDDNLFATFTKGGRKWIASADEPVITGRSNGDATAGAVKICADGNGIENEIPISTARPEYNIDIFIFVYALRRHNFKRQHKGLVGIDEGIRKTIGIAAAQTLSAQQKLSTVHVGLSVMVYKQITRLAKWTQIGHLDEKLGTGIDVLIAQLRAAGSR